MTNRFKIILSVLFVLSLLLGAVSAYGQTSTTTVTVNGNTTTTTTITNTPISTTTTPNTPNIGDITTINMNKVDTSTTTYIAGQNTGNVFSGTNFCNGGWTGTQITNSPTGQTSDLGCNYLTGKGTSSYAENSKTLLSLGISKIEQNYGFTQSANAQTGFFWYHPQSLMFSHSVINNDTGETITQNRILSKDYGNDPNYLTTKSLDNIIIGTNSASGFTSNMRFDFSSSGGTAIWQGADVTSPSLSITYTGISTQLASEIQSLTTIQTCESLGTCYVPPTIQPVELISEQEIKQIFKEEFAKVGLTEADIGMSNLDFKEMANEINTQAVADMKEANPTLFESPEPTSTKESNATTTTTTQETSTLSKTADTKSEQKSEEKQTTTTQSTSNENKKTEGSQKETTNEKTVSDTKTTTNEKGSVNVSVDVKVKVALEKVEKELKSIEDKTKAIQEIKLDAIKSGAPNLSAYESKAFYDVRQMVGVPNPDFFNQINIAQQQIYKDVSLSAYTNKDPIAVRQALQMEIEEEMNKLILEIEQLKRS